MFRKQFILTKESDFRFNWKKEEVGKMNLFYHPDLTLTFKKDRTAEIFLLGSLYDWEYPHLTNDEIVSNLIKLGSFDKLLESISKYCGEFVLFYNLPDNTFILNDACGQSEVYYNVDFTCFGTQPKILSEVIELIQYDDIEAINFYKSNVFKKKCLFVGESTHVKNIKHLLPNNYINLKEKNVNRFFPVQHNEDNSVSEVAQKASLMLKGYIKSIGLRHKIAMAVTGGYDTRVLFLASLEEKCEYYVSKHSNMSENHYDITVPKQLTSIYSKNFEAIPDKNVNNIEELENYKNSVDFPRFLNIPDTKYKNHVYISGNISEIARNYFGYHSNATPLDLSFLNGFSTMQFSTKSYKEWLKNKQLFTKLGYHYLDIFYWEEKMGNWTAKNRTESLAIGKNVTLPFNSRDLLVLLLSVKRKYRDSHYNILYNKIISELSNGNKKVIKIPINPCRKQRIIRLMKSFRIYDLYRYIGLKTRRLKI